MEGEESEDLVTKMGVHLTGMATGIPGERVVSMENGGDIGPTDPRANPQLKERSLERGPTVTGKNQNNCMS